MIRHKSKKEEYITEETLVLTQKWDKIFLRSDKAEHNKAAESSTMYGMARVNANGCLDAEDSGQAHSCCFSRDAYAAVMDGNLCPENKEPLIIPDAVHMICTTRRM